MLRSSQGQIVFINSSAGLSGRAKASQYAATKFGLKAVADCLRPEVNAAGVRVLSVFPGSVSGPMQKAVREMLGEEYPERLLQPEDIAAAVITALGLPRSAEITDINIRPFQP
jgi:NADP-dependent 3-hydroxy acid dehydrogenase YdfG